MPKRLGEAGGRAPIPLPVQDLQGDRPALPAPEQQENASSSSAPSSSHLPKGKAKATQLRSQYLEGQQKEAQAWHARLRREGRVSLGLAYNNIVQSKLKVKAQLNEYIAKAFKFGNGLKNQENEQEFNASIEEISEALRHLYKEAEGYDTFPSPDTISKAKTCLDEFDALPEGIKTSLARVENGLSDLVAVTRRLLSYSPIEKITALNVIGDLERFIGQGKLLLLDEPRSALERMMSATDVSPKVLADVEEMMTELGNLSAHWKVVAEKQAHTLEECEALLGWKNVRRLPADERNNFIQYTKNSLVAGAILCTRFSFNLIAKSVVGSLCLLLLNRHNNGPQENNSLQDWLEFTDSLVGENFSNAQKSLSALNQLYQNLRRAKATTRTQALQKSSTEKWSGEELSLLSQLAGQAQNQLEKLFRTCETSIQEYEKLDGVVKDDRVMPSLIALAEAIAGSMRSNGCLVQFWTSELQELEDKESFLPANMRAQRRPSQAPLPLPEDMHETADGIVVGQIKQEGKFKKLERLGDKGEVTGTYFKDDSGHWIRDYGTEPALEQLAAVTITDQATARDKAVKLMEKAGRMADASLRFSTQARAEVEAIEATGGDYMARLDKKVEVLNRASSRQSAVINQLADILGDLAVLPAQDQETLEEDPKAIVQGHLMRLKEDRKGVESLLQQTKNEQNIHSHKMRDPTEAAFRFLWREGQVASIKKDFSRRQNRAEGKEKDWLERYTIAIQPGPQGEQYEPWIVHAHFDSEAAGAEPLCVHMKRNAEKDWGADNKPYHSLPLNSHTFDLVRKEAQKEEAPKQQAAPKKEKSRRRR